MTYVDGMVGYCAVCGHAETEHKPPYACELCRAAGAPICKPTAQDELLKAAKDLVLRVENGHISRYEHQLAPLRAAIAKVEAQQ